MKLIRYQNPLSQNFGDFDHWFRSPFDGLGRFFELANQLNRYSNMDLAADLYDDDDSYYARVELPGVKRKDLTLELNDGTLSVGFERESDSKEDGNGTVWKRAINVPDGVDASKVSAKLEDGILTVNLPKSEALKPRKIAVK